MWLATGPAPASAQDTIPRLFAEGVVSTGANEFATTFSPDGRTVLWTVSAPNVAVFPFVIVQATRAGMRWQAPRIAEFSGTGYSDGDPAMAPDGRTVVFMSRRPVDGSAARPDFDLWSYDVAARETRHITAVSSDSMDIAPSLAANGNLYFCSSRAGGYGAMDIYRSRFADGRYQPPENLGASLNTGGSESNVFVAPDESYLIFSGDRPGGAGGTDLYIAIRQPDGSFGSVRSLGPRVNSSFDDYAPAVSRDGATLYFTSRRPRVPAASSARPTYAEVRRRYTSAGNGNADIYHLPMSTVR